MQLRTLLSVEDRAVSPVIGVILMVAITVILAAVIGTFVLGLSSEIEQNAPNANFAFDYSESDGELEVTHTGGDGIEADQLYLRGDVSPDSGDGSWDQTGSHSGTVQAGDSVDVCVSGCDYEWDGDHEDATVRVVWQSDSGDQSSTIRTWNS